MSNDEIVNLVYDYLDEYNGFPSGKILTLVSRNHNITGLEIAEALLSKMSVARPGEVIGVTGAVISDALPASKEAEAVAWRYRGYFNGVPLPWQTTDQKWLADRERDSGDEVEPLYAHPPTDAGVSEAMVEAFQEKYREVAERYHWGHSWPAKAPSRELLAAALSTAIPAGDGVPPGMVEALKDAMRKAMDIYQADAERDIGEAMFMVLHSALYQNEGERK